MGGTNKTPYGFPRDAIVVCNLAVGFVVLNSRKHNQPLIFWYAIGYIFRPWPSLRLDHRRDSHLREDFLELAVKG